MKKLICICLLVFLGACSLNREYTKIDPSDPDLTHSMKNYFASESRSQADGEDFEAKIISFDKVAYDMPEYGDSYLYKIVLAIAPRYDKEIAIDSFSFSLSDKAEAYFKNYPHMASHAMFEVKYFESFELDKFSGAKDAEAFCFNLTFDNASNENQKAYGLSDEEFDEMIKELNIVINYNHTSEKITINYPDKINIYRTLDEVPKDRTDLKEMMTKGEDPSPAASYLDYNKAY